MRIKLLKIDRIKLIVLLLILVFVLTVFQDYLFSILQDTGFYLSESLLFNFFWLFFLPFFPITYYVVNTLSPKNKVTMVIFTLGIGAVFSFLHIFFATSFFISISSILFNPPHRFSSIFNSILSNHFYIAFLFYTIAPNIYRLFLDVDQQNSKPVLKYSEKISFKIGSKIKSIETASIQAISTDKPYAVAHTKEQYYLLDRSLKDLESELDASVFLRVHRSAVVNKKFIKELKSRKNGDYDALLANGLWIRFSRHYRKNWSKLLH